ncbi:MAG: putative lipid II flippase FtsW [Deltaproteobacteria bacterium]|jgi:cell division protein FtsW|nr:putative lipid II flippase FtsW [Deltaproteobacteria bacterium]
MPGIKIKSFKNVDTVMLAIVIVLMLLGITMLLSASTAFGEDRKGDPYFYFNEQLPSLLIAIATGTVLFFIPYSFWMRSASVLTIATIIVLVMMLLVPGFAKDVKKTTRFLSVVSFQPSEAARLVLVILLAKYFSYYGKLIRSNFFYGILGPFLILVLFSGLVIKQRDLGGGIIIAIIVILMMIAAGSRIWGLGFVLSFLGYFFLRLIKDMVYRNDRIVGWDNPWLDPSNVGDNIIQAYYAFGRGSLTGVGPGQSQQKMLFLPESHTDYIFAVIGEELGLIGVISLCLLFLVLGGRGFMTARSAKTISGYYLAVGMTLCVIVPAFINMAVALSIIPAKGLPLPFFSYGGSSLLVTLSAIGIIMGIHHQSLNYSGNEYIKMSQAK